MKNEIEELKKIKYFVLTQVFVVFFLYIGDGVHNNAEKALSNLLAIIFSISSYVILFLIVRQVMQHAQAETQNEMLLKQKDIQEEHRMALEESNQLILQMKRDIEEHIRKTNADFHDVMAQKKYVNTLIKNYEKIYMIDFCDNKIIDAILYHKSLIAKAKFIQMDIQAIVPEKVPFQAIDLMCVYTNMIDNAIEAVDMLVDQKRYIFVNTMIRHDYLIVRVENSKRDEQKVQLHQATTKKDKKNHGYGLQIIENTCRKYNGNLKIEDHEDFIVVTAMMNLPKTNKEVFSF